MTPSLPLLGFGLPVSGAWATPETVRWVAQRAEALGYASLWTFQRVLHPVGADLAPAHRSVLDPVVALAFAAGQTERIGLGTATMCAPFTAPTLLAKAMTSLDVLSGGRLSVGLGMGWMAEEYETAGVPFVRRGARFEEYLSCLVALWTDDPVSFAGEFYRVPASHAGPRPIQAPHPPILLGGTAVSALQRAGRRAQGWIAGSGQDVARIGESIKVVRQGAQDAGRDPQALRLLVRAVVELVDEEVGPHRRPFHGSRSQVIDDLVAIRRQGVTEVFFDLNLSLRVGSPDAHASDAIGYADAVLECFAPARGAGLRGADR